jgi:hypothetical protein
MEEPDIRPLLIYNDVDGFLLDQQNSLEVDGSPEGVVETDELPPGCQSMEGEDEAGRQRGGEDAAKPLRLLEPYLPQTHQIRPRVQLQGRTNRYLQLLQPSKGVSHLSAGINARFDELLVAPDDRVLQSEPIILKLRNGSNFRQLILRHFAFFGWGGRNGCRSGGDGDEADFASLFRETLIGGHGVQTRQRGQTIRPTLLFLLPSLLPFRWLDAKKVTIGRVMLLVVGVNLIEYVSGEVVGEVEECRHAMGTVGSGDGQQQTQPLLSFQTHDCLHVLLVLEAEGVLEGEELLIDQSVVLHQALGLQQGEDFRVVVDIGGVVALQDRQDLRPGVQDEEIDEAVCAADGEAGLVLQGLTQQDLFAEAEEAVYVPHDG